MSYLNSYAPPGPVLVAQAPADARTQFIRRTYLHLAGAIFAFAALEFILLQMPFTESLVSTMVSGQYAWLIVLGLFMAGGYVANRWARSTTSLTTQYLGLGLYVVLEAIIVLPLLYIAQNYSDPSVIPTAGVLTLALFGGLTLTAFTTRIDFSFLQKGLMIAMFLAMGVIVAGILFSFTLGLFFSFAMVALAGGYILYYTSQIQYHYRTDQHVAAALALFASVALMFYYILRIFMSRD